MGSFGKGSLQKFSTNFRDNVFLANFHEVSAEFPQTFREKPFANDPISELLI